MLFVVHLAYCSFDVNYHGLDDTFLRSHMLQVSRRQTHIRHWLYLVHYSLTGLLGADWLLKISLNIFSLNLLRRICYLSRSYNFSFILWERWSSYRPSFSRFLYFENLLFSYLTGSACFYQIKAPLFCASSISQCPLYLRSLRTSSPSLLSAF